ncbi:36709_t:CDS:1 [Racocetra persica]|uniref:36709_t:CDS:1 n=1 Tax=Racocetra persica TaxID=160502 RepID=A0ACA9S1C6_9GLOM|nr:36709_t:CDS:1 [Racocetra persica]
MAINQELSQKLKYIERLTNHPNSFSKEEIKNQPNDTPVIKALKNNIRTSEIIKQKDQEITTLKLQLTQKENQLEQTIKDFQEKEKAKHQEYLNILTKKDQD